MTDPLLLLWRLVLLAFFAGMLPGCLGCGGEFEAPGGEAVTALRRDFSAQAGKVLGQEEGFVASRDGFVLEAGAGAPSRRGVDLELPRDAGGAIRFRVGGAGEIRVRELGVEGAGEIAERAVAYRRAGGTSFWAAVPGGVEEWLHLEAGAVRVGEAVASWEVEGGQVRQDGEAVEVVDESGWVRLRVTAPVAYVAGWRDVNARVEGRGGRVELFVDASGESVLVDPLWLTVGSMNTARGYHTATLLGNGDVLVAGGYKNIVTLATAELYNQATSIWTTTGSMIAAREEHTATLLSGSGQVLVAGRRRARTRAGDHWRGRARGGWV